MWEKTLQGPSLVLVKPRKDVNNASCCPDMTETPLKVVQNTIQSIILKHIYHQPKSQKGLVETLLRSHLFGMTGHISILQPLSLRTRTNLSLSLSLHYKCVIETTPVHTSNVVPTKSSTSIALLGSDKENIWANVNQELGREIVQDHLHV